MARGPSGFFCSSSLALLVSASEALPPASASAAISSPTVVAGLPPAQRVGRTFRNLDPDYHRASVWAARRAR